MDLLLERLKHERKWPNNLTSDRPFDFSSNRQTLSMDRKQQRNEEEKVKLIDVTKPLRAMHAMLNAF